MTQTDTANTTTDTAGGGSNNHFYITTTLPYVNATPHIGFAMEIVRADVVARYKTRQGYDVFFNTGTDEHGVKVYEKAQEQGVGVQEYVDAAAQKFKDLLPHLSISEDVHFIRTTDEHHQKAAQAFWRLCEDDIYKGTYEVKYCVGCEMEKTESDLTEDGRCVLHPDRAIEVRKEENYFFRFSAYAQKLRELYENNPQFVIPDYRLNEMKRLIEQGLQDFSISRLKKKMPWGVPVPGDEEHVMYVWFDALVNYISTLGWPDDEQTFTAYWVNGTPTQYAGKDNVRQQSAMWQAMLMSAGLPRSAHIVINGFITSGGQKMSKSLGNVIDPVEVVEQFGTDALRYYLIREVHPFDDSDMTLARFTDVYNANLANGLGNLASRILKMASKYEVVVDLPTRDDVFADLPQAYVNGFDRFELNRVADAVWQQVSTLDQYITDTEPFKTIKTNETKAKQDVAHLVKELYRIGVLLEPLMPDTAARIQKATQNTAPFDSPLFPRIETDE